MKRLGSNRIPKAVGSYSSATQIGNLIFTSGQLPINPDTGCIDYPNSIEWQVRQSLQNISHLLEDNGSHIANIVKTTVYLSDIADFATFNQIYQTFFKGDYPARTAFQVAALPLGALVEIEAVAEVIK